jgi:hypothetical protein
MNQYTQSHAQYELTTQAENALTEKLFLTLQGFTAEEVTALLLLRQWYQNGEAIALSSLRRLEFLRLLVKNGTIAL